MPATLQRSHGDCIIGFKRRGAVTVLAELFQEGCAKARMTRAEPGRLAEAVLINTSGGLTGGDSLSTQVDWGENTTAIVTTQAAERYYSSLAGQARITCTLNAAAGACALWLPREAIMFDGARYQRTTLVNLTGNASFLGIEATVFGRHAMGETVRSGHVHEAWQVRRDGRLIFADAFGLDGPVAHLLARPAITNGAGAMATMTYAGPDAQAARDTANGLMEHAGAIGRATSMDGLTLIRLFAPGAQALRHTTARLAARLAVHLTGLDPSGHDTTPGAEPLLLPRVWAM